MYVCLSTRALGIEDPALSTEHTHSSSRVQTSPRILEQDTKKQFQPIYAYPTLSYQCPQKGHKKPAKTYNKLNPTAEKVYRHKL